MNNDVFIVRGGNKLSGTVHISGSKNAALPLLAATLAIPGKSTITNVPNIADIRTFSMLMEKLGAKISKTGNSFEIDASDIMLEGNDLAVEEIKKMRASILLLAPLLARFGEVKIPFPGGCVLGKRPVEAHLRVFSALGAEILESTEHLHLKLPKGEFTAGTIILPEISVTATENAIVAAACAKGETEIRLAACEPHVQNVCEFFVHAGIKIEGIGTHTLRVHGGDLQNNVSVSVTPDYLEAGTFMLAGILTDSEITIQNVYRHHLDSFLERLSETGAQFTVDDKNMSITTHPRKKNLMPTKIQTGVFPAFPTDLHPQFSVLMTQCEGESYIHETLFEGKSAYLWELEKLGAKVAVSNPHQFIITGPKKLKGNAVASQDIRAGAAVVLATLITEGESEISNISYIHRGYENLKDKLGALGADIREEIR